MPPTSAHSVNAQSVTLAYEAGHAIVEDLSLSLTPGTVTSLIGPNGCGKSTLLRALTRLMAPRSGAVLLDGSDIHRLPTREVARTLGLLAQHADAPGGMTVVDLVRRGRYPHRGPWEPLGPEDEEAVEAALVRCGVDLWRDRPVDELSGGQRQRVWIALALAQQTPVILMDEPTTFLDPEHQQEVMALVRSLHAEEGKTLVLVLHDLVQAAAVSDRIVALQKGEIRADGTPGEVLTPAFLESMYHVGFTVGRDPQGRLVPLPESRLDLGAAPWSRPGAPVLEARGVSAGYHGKSVVGPVDLALGPGGFTVLLGPNGGGKSTLLRTLAGLQPALAGQVLHNGQPLRRGRQAALERAFLSQEAVAPPGVTVAELAGMGRFPHRGPWWKPRHAPEAVARALEILELSEFADRPADRLSGGQKQRVWLALALVQESPLVLLDEPTSFLDPGHQIELLDALWKLTREGPKTVVAILHDPVLAHRYADRVITIGA